MKIKHKTSPGVLCLLSIFFFVFPLSTPLTLTAYNMWKHDDVGEWWPLALVYGFSWLMSSLYAVMAVRCKKKHNQAIVVKPHQVVLSILLAIIIPNIIFIMTEISIGKIIFFILGSLWVCAYWKEMCIRNNVGSWYYYLWLAILVIIICGLAWDAILGAFKSLWNLG